MRNNRNPNLWGVTVQRYWPDGNTAVEIAYGGLNYANPDAVDVIGEFDDPREAAEEAIKARRRWQKKTKEEFPIRIGHTFGFTMPLEEDENPLSDEDVVEWANKTYAELPKCPMCGDLLRRETYFHIYDPEMLYCSEYCAERAYEETIENEKLENEEPN